MSTQRYIRGQRALGIYGTSRLSRPHQRLPEPDIKPIGFACSTVPLSLTDITAATTQSASTTPGGTVALIVTNEAGVFTKYAYDTSDWSLIDSDVITGVVNADTVIAGDDGYFYNMFASGGSNNIWRWPISGSGGSPTLWATYSDFTGNNGIMAFDLSANLYAGGQDNVTGDGVLLELDRSSPGTTTVLHQTSAYDYIEPACCTPDGAVWGWAISGGTTALFRWDGTFTVIGTYASVDNGSAPYPCSDNSIGFLSSFGGAGVRVSPSGEVGTFDCLDGIGFVRDWNGPGGVNILVPSRVVADARALTCG